MYLTMVFKIVQQPAFTLFHPLCALGSQHSVQFSGAYLTSFFSSETHDFAYVVIILSDIILKASVLRISQSKVQWK